MLALLPASAAANPATQIIVKRDPGLTAAERRDIRAAADVRFVETLSLPRTEVVAARPGDVRDAVRDLNADPDVVYAERDRLVSALAAGPDDCDPYGPTPCLWGVARIFENDPDAAWMLSQGAGRTVAVIDSGVDAAHPDLIGQVGAGYDWVDDDSDPADEYGHGTHVAGTIAAARENDTGIVGVAPDATVVPLRVLDGVGKGTASDLVDAFNWAGTKGIRVVNVSLGAKGFLETEYNAIASHQNTLYVVAAGNSNADNDNPATAEYPCAYGIDHLDRTPPAPALDNIICVGASDESDDRASFSNFGATSVDLFAPGVDIISTRLGLLYPADGTSMATPHVAATAALLAARDPSLTMPELKQWIVDGTEAVDAGLRLNARASLDLTPGDLDGDDVLDAVPDNCLAVQNPSQDDADTDGIGDACDDGAPAVDRDNDGVSDPDDVCPDESWPGTDGCPIPAVTAPDADHDGVADSRDPCPTTTVPGGFGCPDADGDRVRDALDNCPTRSNPGQGDADGDSVGDACDPTPRGDDSDGDGRPRLDDSCPDTYGTLANGCPAPPPPPAAPADTDRDGIADASDGCPITPAATHNGCPLAQVASLSAKPRGRTATVRVTSTTAATIRITVERKKGRRWVRVTRKTVVGTRATVRVRRLKRGMHRVRISISSSGGRGTSVSKTFRVR